MNTKSLTVSVLALLVGISLAFSVNDATARSKKGKKEKKDKKVEEQVPPEPVWPSPLDPGAFDGVFKELPFAKARTEFEAVLKTRFEAQFLPILRATLNPSEKDVLKKKMVKLYQDVLTSYTKLDGSEKGYKVSVVAGEFASKADESVYKYAYSENTAYFFFSEDQLWKLFICTESSKDFASLLVRLATLYGDPQEILHLDDEKTIPVIATWRDTTFELRALPPEGIFVCSRLIWTYLPSRKVVEERRAKAGEADDGIGSADAFLQQVTAEDKNEDPDVMDAILKKKNQQKDK